jgi:hypothetical protein
MCVNLVNGVVKVCWKIFEVRTQVDRALTIVSSVDRQLRLLKNLGRHTSPVKSSEPLAGTAVEPPPTMAKGRIARLLFFLGFDLQTKDMVVNPRKVPGAPVKN